MAPGSTELQEVRHPSKRQDIGCNTHQAHDAAQRIEDLLRLVHPALLHVLKDPFAVLLLISLDMLKRLSNLLI